MARPDQRALPAQLRELRGRALPARRCRELWLAMSGLVLEEKGAAPRGPLWKSAEEGEAPPLGKLREAAGSEDPGWPPQAGRVEAGPGLLLFTDKRAGVEGGPDGRQASWPMRSRRRRNAACVSRAVRCSFPPSCERAR